MPLPSSPNQITAGQIRSEFGKKSGSTAWKISHYRRSKTIAGVVWPLDDGIPYGPQDTIRFSDFHGKQHNIVIVLSGGQTNRAKILRDKTSIESTGYRGHRQSIRKTSKNKVYIIRTIGSAKNTSQSNARNKCALRTQGYTKWYGGQPNGGKVLIILGNGGKIYGAGGDGGRGGTEETNGGAGLNGNSALGIQVNVESVTVKSGGRIQAGGGGGGGGGGAREDSGENVRRAGGGGGGGGAGLPAGAGGEQTRKGEQSEGDDGAAGSLNGGGAGGDGGENDDEAHGGGGGGGGSFAGGAVGANNGPGAGGEGGRSKDDGANGGAGPGGGGGYGDDEGGEGESDGGAGGNGGYAITRATGITAPTLIGTTRIKGTVPNNPQGVS